MPRILVISRYNAKSTHRPEAEIFVGLSAYNDMDIHIMTMGEADYNQRFQEHGITTVDFHPEKKGDTQEIKFIRDYLIKHDIDVLFLFNNKAIVNGIQAAKRNQRVKVVLYRGYSDNVYWWDPTIYKKFLHPRVDYIVCNSIGVKQHIAKSLLPRNRKKLKVINKGHDLSWYESITPIENSAFPFDRTNAFVATLVANDRPMKGIEYLLRATYLLPTDKDIRILIIGKGMDKSKYNKIVDKSPNKDKIHRIGFRKDALRYVAASDCFVLASIKGESITKSVLEAMSLGVAPIITDIAGNKELVVDDESGLVVPAKNPEALAQAIHKLYNQPKKREQLAKNAQNRIKNELSNQTTVKKYAELIHSITSS